MKRQTVVALVTTLAALISGIAGYHFGYQMDKARNAKDQQHWGRPYQLTITKLGPLVHGFGKNLDNEETYPVELRLDSIQLVSESGNIRTMRMAMDTSFPLGYTHKAYRDGTGFTIPALQTDSKGYWYFSGFLFGLVAAIIGGTIGYHIAEKVDDLILARQVLRA